jgi:hypothetical protein
MAEKIWGTPPPPKKNEKSELSEMARTLIEKSGECRVLACADTGSEDPVGVHQYSHTILHAVESKKLFSLILYSFNGMVSILFILIYFLI